MKTLHQFEIQLHDGNGLPFPSQILVNGEQLFRLKERKPQSKMLFHSVNPLESPLHFLEGLDGQMVGGGFLPNRILVNGIPFIRRFESFFTPEDVTVDEIVFFFDKIAPRYEGLIDMSLNIKLIKRMFSEIKGRFNFLRQQRKPTSKQARLLELEDGHISFQNSRVQACEDRQLVRILDLGTGTGTSYKVFESMNAPFKSPKVIINGCDISEKMLEICRSRNPSFEVSKCGYAEYPYQDQYFDVVLANFVVHYFIDEKPYFEVRRILKPSGGFIFNNVPLGRFNQNLEGPKQILKKIGFRDVRRYKWSFETSQKIRRIPVYCAVK